MGYARRAHVVGPKLGGLITSLGIFKEVDYEGDWKILAQVRVKWCAYVMTAMNLRVP